MMTSRWWVTPTYGPSHMKCIGFADLLVNFLLLNTIWSVIVGLMGPKSRHMIVSLPLKLIDRWPSLELLSQLIVKSGFVMPGLFSIHTTSKSTSWQ